MSERGAPGGFGFEGLLRGIGDLLHQAANISSDLRRNNGEGQKPMVESRMSVRTVDGEEVGADFFGMRDLLAAASARQGETADAPPLPPERRDVMIEIVPARDQIYAIVELPGADPATIVVRVEQDMLTLSASGPGVEYTGEALLPAVVDARQHEQSFRNGVLELTWPLAAPLP